MEYQLIKLNLFTNSLIKLRHHSGAVSKTKINLLNKKLASFSRKQNLFSYISIKQLLCVEKSLFRSTFLL